MQIRDFIEDQLCRWTLAGNNFRALDGVVIKEMNVGGLLCRIQFNPARIVSSAAKTDKRSLSERPCFLCPVNRPPEQSFLPFKGMSGNPYHILVNPFPIFPDHLVVAYDGHSPQQISGRYTDILDLAYSFQDFLFFYNGPHCGASAPDHHHFQAAGKGRLPLENDINLMLDKGELSLIAETKTASLYKYDKFTRGIFVIKTSDTRSSERMFKRLTDCCPMREGDAEARMNLICYWRNNEYISIVIFRNSHRSHHYLSDGPDHLTMSPGCVDMAGLLIAPIKAEFEKIDSRLLGEVLDEVSISSEDESMIIRRLTRSQRTVTVGVMSAKEIDFEILSDGKGTRSASLRDGRIFFEGRYYNRLSFDEPEIDGLFAPASFVLHNVTIGIGFHWERTMAQTFAGKLRLEIEDDKILAINEIGVEDYLLSVISSEMKSSASEEFLKAHAVISRSWLFAQTDKRLSGAKRQDKEMTQVSLLENEIVRWYGHQDHTRFDVCADDHCQRYQGLTMAIGEKVRRVIDATWGEVITSGGKICDARFSKCCGGRMEVFSSCWEDVDYPYLQSLPDTPGHDSDADPFCKTADKAVLAQVLNDYDLETSDFFEWKQVYGRDELSQLITEKSGIDIGTIQSLNVLQRGPSGRIVKLEIVGDKASFVVGKELEIRKILSESHLKSSNFEAIFNGNQVILHGFGWGHGVGLCQIGAAVMSSRGYTYRQILSHYYPGARPQILEKAGQ